MNDLQHTNTFIFNPYYVSFDTDGTLIQVVDCQNKLLPREFMKALLTGARDFLEQYPTDDHIDFENMKRERRQEKEYKEMIESKAEERRKKSRDREIYLAVDIHRGCYKIGIAKKTEARIAILKTANAGVELVKYFNGVVEDEKFLHSYFIRQGKRISGEWFSLDASDIEYIETYFNQKRA